MRLKRLILALAAAVSVSAGISQTMPAYAAVAAPAAHMANGQAQIRPFDTIQSVDVKAFSGCAEFSGQISMFHGNTPQDVFWEFEVVGGLVVHCAGGTAQLFAYSKCDGVQDGTMIGSTTSTERISEIPDSCDSPIFGAHVLLCYASSAGGACVASGDV